MARQTGQLVIVRHYEPPSEAEMEEVLSRIYRRLLGDAMLTKPQAGDTIAPNHGGEGRYESRRLRTG